MHTISLFAILFFAQGFLIGNFFKIRRLISFRARSYLVAVQLATKYERALRNGLQDFETTPVKKSLGQLRFHRDNALIYGVLTGRGIEKNRLWKWKINKHWRKSEFSSSLNSQFSNSSASFSFLWFGWFFKSFSPLIISIITHELLNELRKTHFSFICSFFLSVSPTFRLSLTSSSRQTYFKSTCFRFSESFR